MHAQTHTQAGVLLSTVKLINTDHKREKREQSDAAVLVSLSLSLSSRQN